MPQSEQYKCPTCGRSKRDGERAYSAFHRIKSASRPGWLSYDDAEKLANINIDKSHWIECHNKSFEPIAVFESAQDIGQKQKPTTMIRNLARNFGCIKCGTGHLLRAYLVFYTLGDDSDEYADGENRIVKLRVRRVWPPPIVGENEKTFDQLAYFKWLLWLRKKGIEEVISAASKQNERNHDIPRLKRKIEATTAQVDMWK